jgi:hypothetical protein
MPTKKPIATPAKKTMTAAANSGKTKATGRPAAGKKK